jgi:hypothetical protein
MSNGSAGARPASNSLPRRERRRKPDGTAHRALIHANSHVDRLETQLRLLGDVKSALLRARPPTPAATLQQLSMARRIALYELTLWRARQLNAKCRWLSSVGRPS